MRLRTGSAALDAALAPLGDAEGAIEDGLVFAPRTGLTTWEEAEAELQDAFRLSQAAMIANAARTPDEPVQPELFVGDLPTIPTGDPEPPQLEIIEDEGEPMPVF